MHFLEKGRAFSYVFLLELAYSLILSSYFGILISLPTSGSKVLTHIILMAHNVTI